MILLIEDPLAKGLGKNITKLTSVDFIKVFLCKL